MATVAVPLRGTTGKARTLLRTVTAAASRLIAPHKASLRRLAEMPLTVAGAGCIDAAAFCGDTIAGLVITGISLILVEHMIADDDEPERM